MEAVIPRDSSGTYSLPPNTLVNSGDTILVSQHNPAMLDIASGLTGSLPRNGAGGMLAALNMNSFQINNVAPGTSATDVATVGQLGDGGVPVGSVVDYAGTSAPDGWLICAGQSLSRTEYSALFATIGTLYGSASGTTFNVPDLRGRVVAGMDASASRLTDATMSANGNTLGATGGAQTVTLTTDQMPAHTHGVTGSTNEAGAHTHSVSGSISAAGGVGEAGALASAQTTSSAGAHSHTISVTAAETGGGAAHGNVQPTIILNKIIRTGVI